MEFYLHNIDEKDIQEVVKVLKSPILTTGKMVENFEKKISDFLKAKYAVGVTSCTAALHLALLAYDIGMGDEVITTPLSFVATANAILHTGAKPIFVDIDESTGNINPLLIEKAITKKTKAIIPVHLYGVLSDMKAINQIAKKHNLKIISDCAHSFESKREDYNSADLCDAACYSFYATKNLSCGEGGAIVTNNKKIAERLKTLRLHGMSKSAIDRYVGKYEHYDVKEIGWKYNMDNIHAALLINQIDRIKDLQKQRQNLYRKYCEYLKDFKQIYFLKISKDCLSAHHLFTIQIRNVEKRDYYIAELQKQNIPVAVNFNPIHLFSIYKKMYGYKLGDYPIAEKIGLSTISLPFYTKLTDIAFKEIIQSIKKCFI